MTASHTTAQASMKFYTSGLSQIIFLVLLTISTVQANTSQQQAMAQHMTRGPVNNPTLTTDSVKLLVSDAILSLQANDTRGALVHLKIINQQLVPSNAGLAKLLIGDAIQNLQKNDTNEALVHLNLVKQQLDIAKVGNPTRINSTATQVNSGNIYNLNSDGKIYPLVYQITGSGNKLNAAQLLTVDNQMVGIHDGLIIHITSQSNGKLYIEIPRKFIDSKDTTTVPAQDDIYMVFKDSKQFPDFPKEIQNNAQVRTLAIDFERGTGKIDITSPSSLVSPTTTISNTAMIPITTLIAASLTSINQEYNDGYNAGFSSGQHDFALGGELGNHLLLSDVQGSLNYREGYHAGYRDGWMRAAE